MYPHFLFPTLFSDYLIFSAETNEYITAITYDKETEHIIISVKYHDDVDVSYEWSMYAYDANFNVTKDDCWMDALDDVLDNFEQSEKIIISDYVDTIENEEV